MSYSAARKAVFKKNGDVMLVRIVNEGGSVYQIMNEDKFLGRVIKRSNTKPIRFTWGIQGEEPDYPTRAKAIEALVNRAPEAEARSVTLQEVVDEIGDLPVTEVVQAVKEKLREPARRELAAQISAAVQSDEKDDERKRLEAEHGQVWDTDELTRDFEIEGFMAPFVVARRKSDAKLGSLAFQHFPRFYWGWKEDSK